MSAIMFKRDCCNLWLCWLNYNPFCKEKKSDLNNRIVSFCLEKKCFAMALKCNFISFSAVLNLYHRGVILMQSFCLSVDEINRNLFLKFVMLTFIIDTPSALPTQPSLPCCVPCILTFLLTALITGKTKNCLNTQLDTERSLHL